MQKKIDEKIDNNNNNNSKLSKPCKKCGRKLTNPTSLKRGYGPICWGKISHIPGVKNEFASTLLGDCINLSLRIDPDVGWRRWYCYRSGEFLFDTQECNLGDCPSFDLEYEVKK